MDNQNITQKLPVKKIVFLVLIIAIVIEVVWALWTILKPTPSAITTPPAVTQESVSKETMITLLSSNAQPKVGEKIVVSLDITADKLTDGADLIINYDPKLLSVDLSSSKFPVLPGTIYSDYPVNEVDDKLGVIKVSGISSKKGGVNPSGIFGTIVFSTKIAGQTKLSFDFTPGSTSDTNIVEAGSGSDVLQKVNNLQINILP